MLFDIRKALILVGAGCVVASTDAFESLSLAPTSPTPNPEPIEVSEVPLPPALANTSAGACTTQINARQTGCIAQFGLMSGNFLPDGNHLTALLEYVGAPAAPDPASDYTGLNLVLLKVDGTTFPNGDAWKCITCGVPSANRAGATALDSYAQTFRDGTRAMAGTNIIDCGGKPLNSSSCTPDKVHIYPIRWNNKADDDGTGAGGSIRELRLHPDDVHLGFSSFGIYGGYITEYGFYGRLEFNATGSRYDVVDVTVLLNPDLPQPLSADGDRLVLNSSAISVGELRGFTGTGNEITYIGYPVESCNIDAFAVDLATGKVRRITTHPEYTDPLAVSPDDKWQVVLDTRGTRRQMFMSGLRTVPPITDIVSITASSSTRNNGVRRFFEPWLLDFEGDRGLYFGQKINAAGDGSPGSINDPNWNSGADPRWSLDGTRIAYYQWLAVSPACGGSNPLECEVSPYEDGRQGRIMVARLVSRKPLAIGGISIAADEVPWGIKYVPGMVLPERTYPPAGDYVLEGKAQGYANVTITYDDSNVSVKSVRVNYHDFSNDGHNVLVGYENVTRSALSPTADHYDWYSNLTSTGVATGTKVTSPDGFHLEIDVLTNFFDANGTLTTTINEVVFDQPCNNC
ncbi:saponin hydrolase precursor [Truncatella angustata]|uniref:Saponin hydrolase n=1 Tax=Truncatella angustata TaxID=152316 RepID=A0A9P8RHD6_9PEZI|nr:saponin hydrolase precursor [Truncatella angustata]KAH6646053.1 saponin hydrolase precursor [Truncatella angustata]